MSSVHGGDPFESREEAFIVGHGRGRDPPNSMFEIVAPFITRTAHGADVELVLDSDPARSRVVPVP